MSQTPIGPIDSGTKRTDFWPAPGYYIDSGEQVPLSFDSEGNLSVRGAVTTDEASFRDDFSGSALSVALTGTLTFTNGSSVVVGSGTAFTEEIHVRDWVRNSADGADVFYEISKIVSDTQVELVEVYAGSTASGATGYVGSWGRVTASGGGLSVASSCLAIDSGSTSNNVSNIYRLVDFLPLVCNLSFDLNFRTQGQESLLGYVADPTTASASAYILLDGSDPYKGKFVTSSSSAAADTKTTTFSISSPTSVRARWRIELLSESASLFYGDTLVAQHKEHLPDPYQTMYFLAQVFNNGVTVSGETRLTIDSVSNFNTDVLQVGASFAGTPLTVNAQSLLDQALYQMTAILQQIRGMQGFPDTAGRQRITLDAITAGVALPTVTAVTTVSTVTNQAQVGSLLANYDQVNAWNTVPALNRARISVT